MINDDLHPLDIPVHVGVHTPISALAEALNEYTAQRKAVELIERELAEKERELRYGREQLAAKKAIVDRELRETGAKLAELDAKRPTDDALDLGM